MKKLSREQLKQIKGGDDCGGGGTTCNTNADCGQGQKCDSLPGLPKICMDISRGTSCTSNADCGNGMSCVDKPVGTGKWCN